MVQSAGKKGASNKKKVDSSFFVGKLDATSSCVEYYQPINGGEGQLGGQFQVLLTPKKVNFLFRKKQVSSGTHRVKNCKSLGLVVCYQNCSDLL